MATLVDHILNDRTEIANAAQATVLADCLLPSIFPGAQAWRARLQSELEAGAALNVVAERVDLADASVRVLLKVPIADAREQPLAHVRASKERCLKWTFFSDVTRRTPYGGPRRRVLNPDGEHQLPRLTSAIGDPARALRRTLLAAAQNLARVLRSHNRRSRLRADSQPLRNVRRSAN
jgi:hypothetical protein